jgi:hypothetical protein
MSHECNLQNFGPLQPNQTEERAFRDRQLQKKFVITSGFHHGVLVVHDFVGFFDLVYFLVD